MTRADGPLEDILDGDTLEVWRVLRNSVRNQGSIFDRAARAIETLARDRLHLLELTAELDEHPEGYNGECWCRSCRKYAGESGDAPVSAPMA